MNPLANKRIFLFFLVLFNVIPVYGVLAWDWHTFDLVFLYWLENAVIGVVMILRMLIRPYSSPLQIVIPLFLVPFFTVHYGGFTYGHGVFVVSLFGEEFVPGTGAFDLEKVVPELIESRHLFWPLVGLAIYQLLDWIRDSTERGFGSDGAMQLTVMPYRRIIVLHITILGSGFALTALNEPFIGLLMLIAFKTGMDIYHWDKDEKNAAKNSKGMPVLDEKIRKKVDAFLEDPKITVNGKEQRFESYEDFKKSPHYKLFSVMMGVIAGAQQQKALEAYIAEREANNDSQ